MQNRSAIWIFTILLALACLYQLSFSYYTSSFEKDAEEYAVHDYLDSVLDARGIEEDAIASKEMESLLDKGQQEYISQNQDEPLVPIFGQTYRGCKDRQLKMGLDLEGGMSVTVEVLISDLITQLSNESKSTSFNSAVAKAKELQKSTSGKTFIDLFEEVWTAENEDGKLIKIFNNFQNKDRFPAGSTDEEVFKILREEAESAVANTENIIRARIDQFGVAQPIIQRQQFTDRILVELPGAKDKQTMRKIIERSAKLEFWELYTASEVMPSLVALNERIGKDRYPELFVESEPDSTAVNSDPNDTTATAAADDPDADRIKQMRKNPLFAHFYPAQTDIAEIGRAYKDDRDTILKLLNDPQVQDLIPGGGERIKWVWTNRADNASNLYTLYALKSTTTDGSARLDGSSIADARQDFDPYQGGAVVSMTMNSEGTKVWKNMTKEATQTQPHKQIAVVLDDLVFSAPRVNEPIETGRSQITVGGQNAEESIKEASDLANLLKAGALPAKPEIVDEIVIGPTIGEDNKVKGLRAFAIALGVILLYMIFYYSGAGGISDIALLANMFFLVGALASLGASLTLPGIAGIILTIGMAVDANVLIFERIKEELRAGAGKQAAIKKGYQKAYSAILDANITTFLTGLVLFFLGSGPIKGFATTLMIGILTSLFSAIFITRLIISWRMDAKKDVAFYTAMTKNLFSNTNIDFIGKRKVFYALSLLIIGTGIGFLVTRGLDFGVDFTGGRTYDVSFVEKNVTQDQVTAALETTFKEGDSNNTPSVKTIGATGDKFRITTNYKIDESGEEIEALLENTLTGPSGLGALGQLDMDDFQSSKVASTISDDFRDSSMLAIGFALLIIFLYILLRFRKKEFGIGALVAMAHDVLVVLGLFSIFYNILPFSMEIDQAFIAAILTVVGYSINDTVVVFDRLREYLKERRREAGKDVINAALNSTLGRTVNTSLSTFVVLLMIFIFGSDSIRGFTFALMVGVIVGTYSSLCIATPLVVDLSKKDKLPEA